MSAAVISLLSSVGVALLVALFGRRKSNAETESIVVKNFGLLAEEDRIRRVALLAELNTRVAAAEGKASQAEARADELHDIVDRLRERCDAADLQHEQDQREISALRSRVGERDAELASLHVEVKELRRQVNRT